MELITNYLYKVDIKTKSVEKTDFHDSQHLKDYVMNVIHKVTDSVGDREYKFLGLIRLYYRKQIRRFMKILLIDF